MPDGNAVPQPVEQGMLMPYQLDWLADRAPQKASVKSRRVGFTEVATLECALRAMGLDLCAGRQVDPVPQCIISAGLNQAIDFLRRVKLHVDVLGKVFGRDMVISSSATLLTIEALNGEPVQLRAFSTNPATIRSFEGDVTLDEFAAIPRMEAVYAAARPLANPTLKHPKGFQVRVIFTPLGDDNMAYEIARGRLSPAECRKRGERPAWSVHETSIYKALEQGFPADLERLRQDAGSDDIFEQEYNIGFLSASARYISAQTYDDATWTDGDKPPSDMQALIFAGMDVARHAHKSSIVIAERMGDVLWHLGTDSQRDVDWDTQEAWVAETMDPPGRPRVSRIHIDGTGIGDQFGERLCKRFPGRVESVVFGQRSKEELATGLKLALERGRFRPREGDAELRRAVLSMRREVTSSGNITYRVPEDKQKGTHADEAWAAALCVQAAGGANRSNAVPKVYTPSMGRDEAIAGLRQRMFSGGRGSKGGGML